MIDITAILLAAIALIGALVTGLLVPWIKSKTSFEQQAQLQAWARIAVSAAEQIYHGSGRGEEKKAYVTAWLAERGLRYDEETIDAAVEAAVYGLGK